MSDDQPLDLDAIRARLAAERGPRYWRALEELSEEPALQKAIADEFAPGATEWQTGMSRRRFLQLMGASFALAGLTACVRRPERDIIPYVRQPEDVVPGKPLFFSSALCEGAFARGVLVESHEGRPTKIEGNPGHPASLGATDAAMQAEVLSLYDPDRSQAPSRDGVETTWGDFLGELATEQTAWRANGGRGVVLVTPPTTSHTLLNQLATFTRTHPNARWLPYDPLDRYAVYRGVELAYGRPLEPRYHFERARVVLGLQCDQLERGPQSLVCARGWAAARQPGPTMSRCYAAESVPTLFGASADHQLPVRPEALLAIAASVAAHLGMPVAPGPGVNDAWARAVAADLAAHRGASLVLAGETTPPELQALCHAINDHLGNVGTSVTFSAPVQQPIDSLGEFATLCADLHAGRVDTLFLLGVNPVYDAPPALDFAGGLKKVRTSVHAGLHRDETGTATRWHLPLAHALESWGDARAFDGTASVQQPLIMPLYQGRSLLELVASLNGVSSPDGHALVMANWRSHGGATFGSFWSAALRTGVIPGTAAPTVTPGAARVPAIATAAPTGLSLVLTPDPYLHGGRQANNGWLQELPRPITKLTWDNAALVSPALAQRLGVEDRSLLELSFRGQRVVAPVLIQPGHADDCVSLSFGYGRQHTGHVADGVGVNAYALRAPDAPYGGAGLTVQIVPGSHALAPTRYHHVMDGRDIVREATLAEFQANPHFVRQDQHAIDSILPEYEYERPKWGMAIDTSLCIGCNACVAACQAENNIPVVGKEQVLYGREMHWLRVDHYYEGTLDSPSHAFMPVPCMQCEKAPCELVCPTGATVHSHQGLNDMVYNRCVGTRYCSNNCPYKVRRFNFLQYADTETPVMQLVYNPDVTVRERGVMEKCTYCVQRINAANIESDATDTPIPDGRVRTACQAACPTQAIVFGDAGDPAAQVTRLKQEPRNYALFEELNTQPRTTYLGRVRNPNPVLES